MFNQLYHKSPTLNGHQEDTKQLLPRYGLILVGLYTGPFGKGVLCCGIVVLILQRWGVRRFFGSVQEWFQNFFVLRYRSLVEAVYTSMGKVRYSTLKLVRIHVGILSTRKYLAMITIKYILCGGNWIMCTQLEINDTGQSTGANNWDISIIRAKYVCPYIFCWI